MHVVGAEAVREFSVLQGERARLAYYHYTRCLRQAAQCKLARRRTVPHSDRENIGFLTLPLHYGGDRNLLLGRADLHPVWKRRTVQHGRERLYLPVDGR